MIFCQVLVNTSNTIRAVNSELYTSGNIITENCLIFIKDTWDPEREKTMGETGTMDARKPGNTNVARKCNIRDLLIRRLTPAQLLILLYHLCMSIESCVNLCGLWAGSSNLIDKVFQKKEHLSASTVSEFDSDIDKKAGEFDRDETQPEPFSYGTWFLSIGHLITKL